MANASTPGATNERSFIALFLAVLIGLSSNALAQDGNTLRELSPGADLPPLPQLAPSPPPNPDLELPARPKSPSGTSIENLVVKVEKIEIVGNRAISDAELYAAADAYLSREVTLEELFRLQDELTQIYVNAGYLNSGALLVPQDVGDGTVRYEITEGNLDDVRITGLSSVGEDYFRDRLLYGTNTPFNRDLIAERMRVLLLRPDFDRIKVELQPGSEPGEASLDVQIKEGKRFGLVAEIANDQSPGIGETQARIGAKVRSLAGRTDELSITAGINEGLLQGRIRYEIPVWANDLRLYTSARYSESEIITDGLDDLDIESRTWNGALGLSWPIIDQAEDRLVLDLGLTREHQQTDLLGEPFDFSDESENGETDLSVARFTQTYLQQRIKSAASIASTFSLGLPILGASDNAANAKSEFLSWLVQGQYIQRISAFTPNDQFVLRGRAQISTDPLFSSEQFAVGGLNSVQGFRVNELSNDAGWRPVWNFEYLCWIYSLRKTKLQMVITICMV